MSLPGNVWNKWIQLKYSDFEPTGFRKGAAMALVPFVVTEAAHI
jgi:hypothetical protein